ncbi:hypothetical protein [Natronosalvus rutilus]|uniref:Uncharacterized protein n=1 Tax=Natronosalvus rutilus TaxID=2953753 RepID=A0A9E7N8D7_9EURY|nr:hypothetical protein [Natronosalvus rutilus]UTF52756.1 hypothetical protein NGM29_13315 [Natronosalvus rutilus]
MLWILALIALVVVAYYWHTRGRIPTPVPRHLARRGRDLSSDGLIITVYRVALVVLVVGTGLFALAVNPSGLVAFFAAGVFLWAFMDDLTATLVDIWNGDFWVFKP